MNIKQYLVDILSSSGYEVYKQGTMLDTNTYPDSFYTYYNIDSEELYYDDESYAIVRHFTICFYTNDIKILQKEVDSMRKILKNNRFIVSADEDISPSDKSHYGLGFIAIYQYNY